MLFQRIAIAAVFAAGLAALPAPGAKAQALTGCYSPAFWPLCTAANIATVIVTAPFWLFNPATYAYSGPYYGPYPPPPPDVYPRYSGGPYYYGAR